MTTRPDVADEQPTRPAPPNPPAGAGPTATPDAAAVYRYEAELRRLRAELERQQAAMRQLSGRLRDAEREAATASGAVVDAVRAELAGWQSRAVAAETELAAVRATKVYRAAAPFMAVYRVRRRLPELGRKLTQRLS